MTSETIGDLQKTAKTPIAVALPQSVVLADDISDKDNAINDASISGKKAGATIVVDSSGLYAIYIAQGGDKTSEWKHTNGTGRVIPA